MKAQLRAGAELDILNRGELADELSPLLELLRTLQRREPRWIRADVSGQLDNTGGITLDVYRVPQGCEFRVGRLVLEVDGQSAANPFNGGGVQLLRDGVLVSPIPGPLPAVSPYPLGAQPRFRNGDLVQVQVIAGPADGIVTASIEGSLHRGAP